MVLWAVFFIISTASAKLKPSKVVYAIDCGGRGFKSRDGVVFRADDYFQGGSSSDFGLQVPKFRFTDQNEVYQTERYDNKDFSYELPVSADDKYVLVLKFSEVWFDQQGQKVFSVKLGDKVVVHALDVFAVVGKNSAYDEFIEFELKQGKVYIGNSQALGAYQNGRLKVKFVKMGVDNPKVNGIVLVRGTLADTHYAEQKKNLAWIAQQQDQLERSVFVETADDDLDYEAPLHELLRHNSLAGVHAGLIATAFLLATAALYWLTRSFIQPKLHRS
jgi:hypothetical protein